MSETDTRITPVGPFDAVVRPPGSKSLTQRALICASLADGASRIRGALLADDTRVMLDALRQAGVSIGDDDHNGDLIVTGSRGQPEVDGLDLNVSDAGTAMRFLTAFLCLGYGTARIDGSPRMRERPIGSLVNALHALGAGIGYDGDDGFPPLTIVARGLDGGRVDFDRPPSSQYISALLMTAPYARRDVLIRVNGQLTSRPYVEMTIDTMRAMGVEVLESDDGQRFIVPATQRYQARLIDIEPDASSATYFLAAAAVTGGRVRIEGLGRNSRQGDVRFVELLARMGAAVDMQDDYITLAGPDATLVGPAANRLRGVDESMNDMPDSVQTLAVVALFADGPTRIRNVANLRIKETDRLAALSAELTRLGAAVDLHEDGLTIFPPKKIAPAAIETYGDHRMAMSFAIAGLVADGIVIRDAGVVSKSFPAFFAELQRATGTTLS